MTRRRQNKAIRHLKKNYTWEIILSLVIMSSFITGVFYSQVNYEKKINADYKPPQVYKTPPNFNTQAEQPETVDTVIYRVNSGDNHNITWNSNITNKQITFFFKGHVINQSVSVWKYECRFDNFHYVPCKSPVTMFDGHVMDPGQHVFDVRAVDNKSNADPTPATFVWSVPK